MSTYGERLAQAMKRAKLTERDARAKLAAGITQLGTDISVQAIGQVLTTPGRAFSAEVSAQAARFLRVDHYWLATGIGEIQRPGLSDDAQAFALAYDKLNVKQRELWHLFLEAAQKGAPDPAPPAPEPKATKTRRKEKA